MRLAASLCVLAAGCAAENVATLEVPGHPLGRTYHVTDVKIDGVLTDGIGGSDESFEVAPGRHVVEVWYGKCVHGLDRYPFPTLKEMALLGAPRGHVEVETQVGRTYVLHAWMEGGGSLTTWPHEFRER